MDENGEEISYEFTAFPHAMAKRLFWHGYTTGRGIVLVIHRRIQQKQTFEPTS